METIARVAINEEEIKLIKSLQRLAKRWEKHGDALSLVSMSGSLYVCLNGDTDKNPQPEFLSNGCRNPRNVIVKITGIKNDGGDW